MENDFVFAFNAVIENKVYFMDKWNAMAAGEGVLNKMKSKQLLKLIERARPIQEFDAKLFHKLVEKMTVYERSRVVVTLVDGSGVGCEIE